MTFLSPDLPPKTPPCSVPFPKPAASPPSYNSSLFRHVTDLLRPVCNDTELCLSSLARTHCIAEPHLGPVASLLPLFSAENGMPCAHQLSCLPEVQGKHGRTHGALRGVGEARGLVTKQECMSGQKLWRNSLPCKKC